MCQTSAKRVENEFVVEQYGACDGDEWLTLAIDPDDPYSAFKALPDVIEFEFNGRKYGKTGFNSDTNVAYYSTGAKIARKGN